MNIHEAIRQRHSVRSYTNMPIEEDKLETLKKLVEICNLRSGLHIQLISNDPKAFDSRLAHYGKFTNINNYFAMIGPDNAVLDEKVGYYGEQLVLKAQMLGLNTCWVGLTYKKNPEVLDIRSKEKLRCLIALGHGLNQGVQHKMKTIDKVSSVEGEMPEWFKNGVESALLAPTAMNQQQFKFTLKGTNTVEADPGWGFFSRVDLGIAMFHFEVGAGKDNFQWAVKQ